MTDYAPLLQPDRGDDATAVLLLTEAEFDDWLINQPDAVRAQVAAHRFAGKRGECLALSGVAGAPAPWVAGVPAEIGTWDLASLAARLPEGRYRLSRSPGAGVLGWMLAQYRFETYKAATDLGARILLTDRPGDVDAAVRAAEATALVRDLVNTPALDMGPEQIEAASEVMAKRHDATIHVTRGGNLEAGYPMIHAVGMAAERSRAPRLIEMSWGHPDHPRIAIIGKGVTFDSGGLNIKPGSGMRQMKKDMGGAAHALGLAHMIMGGRMPVRLHLLIPTAENSIAGNAFRPGDVLRSRKGLSVEIDNTDAEGRLILADALTRAAEEDPTLIIDFATLTGAARVALGPDLPALFANDHDLARDISEASVSTDDPVWRLPLWSGYDDMLSSDIADLVNSAEGGLGGAITAALFLRRFVDPATPWAHLDTFAWRPKPKPGRPKGGDALGLRAVYAALKARFPSV
jgi:leucyl aminopeptidase